MLQLIPHLMVALVALGMALAFIWADYRSPTSRLLAMTLVCLALAIALNTAYLYGILGGGDMPGWLALPEGAALLTLLEWVQRVRRTLPAGELDVRIGDFMLRCGQVAGLVYCALSVLYPDVRQHDFLFAAGSVNALRRPGFWLFAIPLLFASGTGLFSGALILNRKPDRGERVRIIALGVSVPFFLAGFVLPEAWAPVSVLFGELVFLVGSVQYHVLQGQRGQFMSRFLSAQVASLVRERGLSGAMKQNYLEITAVVSDVRGFTAYAQAHPSSRVIQVLRDYYDAVGEVVAAYGGTIKDYAGDGILILVGAPIPMPNHAAVGLAIARGVRDAAKRVTDKWSSTEHRLGLGIGVASGFVTVGVIGSASRLEYTAVGPAVNLSTRLCEQALDGEILVDGRTRELAGEVPLEVREPIAVKGFAEAVALYALPAAA
jgi:class 3 adenylate cyclase